MAIATIITRGYGNGTYIGTIPLVVARGYLIGDAAPSPDVPGLEYTLPSNKLHFAMPENKLHFTVPNDE